MSMIIVARIAEGAMRSGCVLSDKSMRGINVKRKRCAKCIRENVSFTSKVFRECEKCRELNKGA